MAFKDTLKNFLQAKAQLESYTNRKINHFGDIGELVAEQLYDITLCDSKNAYAIDGTDIDGDGWQIKASFTENRHQCNLPQHPVYGYLALKIHENGDIEEIYNGPFRYVLLDLGIDPNDPNPVIPKFLSISRLREIQKQVVGWEMLPRQ